ncbi:MAG: urease accessory protein UreF [Candidatus Poribacteria bacterium]|nr:urease accessory protein UreF [Candidatus Poribacteria bacterium]
MTTEKSPDGESLLTLLQLVDSFFPTGAFAHSFGLETYVQHGLITNGATLEEFLRASLHHSIRNVDAPAVALAYRAAQIHRIEQIAELDARLTALKLPREAREGSIKIGKQFLRNVRRLFTDEMLEAYSAQIQSGVCAGHHSIAYGLATAAASTDLPLALQGYLHSYVAGQVSAAVRLIPLGATEGQQIIQAIRQTLLEICAFALDAQMEDLGSFTPGLDIRSMQHERLYSRLFIS